MPVLPLENDLIIAADKGVEILKGLGITPDITVGDFDSLGFVPQGDDVVKLSIRKDDTDTAHCIELAESKGYNNFYIYGAVGGKLDHTFANIQIASNLAQKGKRAVFIGEKENFTVIRNGRIRFDASERGRISVFSLCDESRGVTEKGLSYTLENAVLYRNDPLGISNEFIGSMSEISVDDGELLVVWEANCLPDITND